jgi:osmotically-inducible protein OsmY
VERAAAGSAASQRVERAVPFGSHSSSANRVAHATGLCGESAADAEDGREAMMDQILEQAVLSALYLEPSIDVSRILATVRNGVAILSGDVDTHAQKVAAKFKVEGVPGIREVVDELEVCAAEKSRRGFEHVADEVLNALFWDLAVPRDRVSAKCEKGWVILMGEVERQYQKSCAEADVRRTPGVVGVTNQIRVEPGAKIDAARCGEAFKPKTAEFCADGRQSGNVLPLPPLHVRERQPRHPRLRAS